MSEERSGALEEKALEEKAREEKETAREGFRRLAFGSIGDAVRLLYAEPGELCPKELEKLDLFPVSEMKRGKDGQLELKFYDRLKALQCLSQEEGTEEETPPLYDALWQSAQAFARREGTGGAD